MADKIPTDIRERVKARLDEGAYQSEEDVLRDAMDALEQRELERVTRWNERNQLAVEQSKEGVSKPLDDERVLTRLWARLAKEGILG